MRTFDKFLHAKQIDISGAKVWISLFDAIAGRDIISNYITSNVPKVFNEQSTGYNTSEETMLKLMSYVAIEDAQGNKHVFNSRGVIDSHLSMLSSPWEALVKIELAMMEYNCSFFQNGRISSFLGDTVQKALQWTMSTWTGLSEQSSQKEEQPSTSSEPSIH